MKRVLAISLVVAASRILAADVPWTAETNMDGQLFPSLVIATATVRPDEEEEKDPAILGDAYGFLGVSIKSPAAGTKIKVTIRENSVMNASSWSGELAEADVDYYVAPPIDYKFDRLRQVRQQVPLNVQYSVEIDGKPAGDQTKTITVRSINDCPFAVQDAEEMIADTPEGDGAAKESDNAAEDAEEEESDEEVEQVADDGFTDLGWMFAAYVNESSPAVEKVLKEALKTGVVDAFGGYQRNAEGVVLELFAIWKALQDRGIRYSNITTTPGGSELVHSQHVRFVDESLDNQQANCVDGSVLFASVLRKLGMRPFLVTVPGHMYMGVYLTEQGNERIALETTMLGTSAGDDEAEGPPLPSSVAALQEKLPEKISESSAWKTFAQAIAVGTADLKKNRRRFNGPNTDYQINEVAEARSEGIMPISYQKAD